MEEEEQRNLDTCEPKNLLVLIMYLVFPIRLRLEAFKAYSIHRKESLQGTSRRAQHQLAITGILGPVS